jgi:hypothetical protein
MKQAGQGLIRSYPVVIGLLLATALSACLSACTALPGPARDENAPAARGVAFEGLISADPGRPRTRYIFQIHGINAPSFSWGQALLNAISASGYDLEPKQGQDWTPAQLAASRTVKGRDLVCDPPHADCRFDAFGKYRKDVFVDRAAGDRIVVFSYSWHDDLWSITGHYVKPDIQDNTLSGPTTARSLANAYVKVKVIDQGFSDAVGYLSRLGGLEREGIETTICAMLADAAGVQTAPHGEDCLTSFTPADIGKLDAAEFDFLSHSLGSRMIYDVLSGVAPESGKARGGEQLAVRTALRRRTHMLIMAANQMPLLAATEFRVEPSPEAKPNTPPGGEAPAPERPLGFINLNAPASGGVAPAYAAGPTLHLTVIAFQDPDDLLGFKASDAVLGSHDDSVTFVDVLHRNTSQWAFLFAMPELAHDHELEEPNSLKMILCGADVGPDGRLQARECRRK